MAKIAELMGDKTRDGKGLPGAAKGKQVEISQTAQTGTLAR